MRRLFGQSYKALVWVLLPLALYGGSPVLGCLCANGQTKLFCSQLLGGGCQDCSERAADSKPSAVRSPTTHRCCHGAAAASTLTARPLSCCRLLIGAPTTTPESVSFTIAWPVLGVLGILSESTPSVAPPSDSATFALATSSPVLDRVIAHCRLLI